MNLYLPLLRTTIGGGTKVGLSSCHRSGAVIQGAATGSFQGSAFYLGGVSSTLHVCPHRVELSKLHLQPDQGPHVTDVSASVVVASVSGNAAPACVVDGLLSRLCG